MPVVSPLLHLLAKPLLYTKLGMVSQHALELLLLKNQQMVEAFLPDAPQKAFADRIGSGSVIRGLENLNRTRGRYPSKGRPKFGVVITNQILECLSIGGRFSELWATQASLGERVTPTWITLRDLSSTTKNAKSGRKNRSVTCKKSQAQICAA
jgi:hypothetical protein